MATVDRAGDARKRKHLVRWRDEQGTQRKKGFERKTDADRFRAEIEHSLNIGRYVDPAAGRKTFREVAEAWRTAQPARPNTAARHKSNLEKHVYPVIGAKAIATIRQTQVQAFVTGLGESLKPSSTRVVFSVVRAIFASAVRDQIIGRDPCIGVRMPEVPRAKVVPLTVEQVETLADCVPTRFRALVVAGAGLGLRQGELFGQQPGDVDFLRRTVQVERQVQPAAGGGAKVGPVKNKFSLRTVPASRSVLAELSTHLRRFPPAGEWLFSTPDGKPLSRSVFNDTVWRPARDAAAARFRERAAAERDKDARAELLRRADQLAECGMHDLRHFFASLLIRGGLNPKVVAERMGHANASMTLNVYSHLWPDDEDRTREAVDVAFGHDPSSNVPAMCPEQRIEVPSQHVSTVIA